MSLLSQIRGPADVKALDASLLPELAQEIRDRVIEVTSQNGGHIGPNLGVVELTLALHRVFDCPQDRFVWDVSHQGYVHKLLTGRNDERFDQIRRGGGLSGFLSREESEYDCYGAGHAGTGLSAALGMATARDLAGGDEHVVAICGDAAFTCGITMEALNNVALSTRRLIVILNDNEWSIDKNVGAIARYFNELITNPIYQRFNDDLEHVLRSLPGGDSLVRIGSHAKREAKDMLVPSSLFEKYGLRYLGPIDGHNLPRLVRYLEFARDQEGPILIHVLTQKGKGCNLAIAKPEKFHGTSPFDPVTGKGKSKHAGTPPNYQDVFGQVLLSEARQDERVVGITAAMPSGTGLSMMRDEMPERYFDVGIAEEHAVLFAAGMATRGLRPVCGIYSTFLQRAYDPIIHDVCLQNLPVLFCMDRAGLSPNDGPTHHGVFDIAYLRCAPHTVIMQPKDEDELCDMVHTGLRHQGPAFIRYPRGAGEGVEIKTEPRVLPIGVAEEMRNGTGEVIFWALGPMVGLATQIADRFKREFGIDISVVNARFAKPLDEELLGRQARQAQLVVTFEDHVLNGGFGSGVLELLQDLGLLVPVERFGWPDAFIGHGSSVDELRKQAGLDFDSIWQRLHKVLGGLGLLHLAVAAAHPA